MLVEHDGQELVDGQHAVEGARAEQLAGAAGAEQVAQRPVRVQRPRRVLRHVLLLIVLQDLTTYVPEHTTRAITRLIHKIGIH